MSENQIQELPKIKIIFLGDQGTGKSSILNRFVNDKFDDKYQATVGLDFNSKIVKIDNQDVRLILFDTAGQEKFKSLIQMYTRDAQIIILVYDITRKESFESIPEWVNGLTNVKKEDVIFCLVGNKIDLPEKAVDTEEAKKYAENNNYIFEEVSAKTGENFNSLFYKQIFERIITKFKVGEKENVTLTEIGKINLSQNPVEEDKSFCCKK